MAGHPDWFEVTGLEVVAAGASTGAPMKDVIEVSPTVAGDPFRLIVTFGGQNTPLFPGGFWLGTAEANSDAGPPIPVNIQFWAESIGPGVEVEIGADTINLTAGGDPGGSPTVDTSLYQKAFDVANANPVFTDSGGTLQPGVYRIGCAVSFEWPLAGVFADAYFDQDLVVRVVERP